MPTYQVVSTDEIYTTVTVTLAEEELEGKTFDEIIDIVTDRAFEDSPGGLCIHCSGYNSLRNNPWSRETGETMSDPIIQNEEGVTIWPVPDPQNESE